MAGRERCFTFSVDDLKSPFRITDVAISNFVSNKNEPGPLARRVLTTRSLPGSRLDATMSGDGAYTYGSSEAGSSISISRDKTRFPRRKWREREGKRRKQRLALLFHPAFRDHRRNCS